MQESHSKAAGWKTLRGQLINDGSNDDANVWTKAPHQLGDIADYAVETDIQVVSVADPQFDSFGMLYEVVKPRRQVRRRQARERGIRLASTARLGTWVVPLKPSESLGLAHMDPNQ